MIEISQSILDSATKIKAERAPYPWSNKDNFNFYQTTPVKDLKAAAKVCGINTGCDIKILHPLIHQAKNILEIGAGYGRSIEFFYHFGCKGDITAIERCEDFCTYLQKKYKNLNIIQEDICHFSSNKKFDLITWLWSGIGEFSPPEQLSLLSKFITMLNPNGILAVDIVKNIQKLKHVQYSHKNW
jgi:SAM-dependent methyltransferase